MNRSELNEAVAEAADVPTETARRCLEALFGSRNQEGVLPRVLGRGDKVQLVGFGTFEVRQRPARRGHNPRTGESIDIAARASAVYRPASSLQRLLQAPQAGAAPGAAPGTEGSPGTHPGRAR
jgi:DNA-binding protein HU-beta